ncbi:ABC transporter substrate-binding protein [Pseudomonas sp. TH31]|uniref:ABC transporter substrate-binding protein n=1 Tax=Pseudomonas sp. TH31 TaxID=2796396 RepID=UPI0019135634|nr:ABC transporter substrate-binding protein [Pseudomonas sp. TH31]MBK5416204.1 ABC transporter substrate-binding protein [Pseudomonas sp. TH31]
MSLTIMSAVLSAAEAPVKVGVIAPLSGVNSRYGAFATKGAQLAARQINEAGGVLSRPIELLLGDSQCVPAEGVSATQRMINFEHISMIIGDACSSVTMAMQPVVEDAGVLLLNAASSNPQITYKAGVGGYRWSFRNYPTDESRAAIALQYAVQKRGFTRFAVLAVDSDYGRGAIDFTRKYLASFGATLTSEDYYKETETDFRPVLTKIKYSDAQAIITYGQADSTPIIARQMNESALGGKLPLIGNGEFTSPTTIAAAPKVLNGSVEVTAWLPEWQSAGSLQFVKDYQQAYGGELPNVHAFFHWETLRLLAQAIRQAGTVDPVAVRDTLATIHYASAMGEVVFDDHHQAVLPMALVEIEANRPVIKATMAPKIDYAAH